MLFCDDMLQLVNTNVSTLYHKWFSVCIYLIQGKAKLLKASLYGHCRDFFFIRVCGRDGDVLTGNHFK